MIHRRRHGLDYSRARYLCLHSPAYRAAIELVRTKRKPLRNGMIETRKQLDMLPEKGSTNAPPQPRLPI